MMDMCIKCNVRPARPDGLLCIPCKKEEDKKDEQRMKAIWDHERRKMGMTLEEYHARHPKDCPRCHGDMVLTFYCFWAEAGDYDYERKMWR